MAARLVLALALVWVTASAGCAPEPPARPNLLLVSVDTLRPDHLACYGGRAGVGPALCAVAGDGIRYRWAFSTAPSTAPAIASILTSRYPSEHGVSQFAATTLADATETLAERLRGAGYATAAVVANPVLDRSRNLHQGFDVYDDQMQRPETNRPTHREREAREVTDAALRFARAASAPWFLWIHYQDPHGPYDPPGAAAASDPVGAEPLPLLADHSGRGGIPAYQALPGLRTREGYAARYRAEILHLDIQIARLLAALDTGAPLGIALTADHGEAFGEDGYFFAHGHSVALEQIRVPLLWRPPGGAPPRTVQRAVSVIDIAPTLLRAAGLSSPAGFRGRVLPGNDDDADPRPVFAEHRARVAVVSGDRYYARDLASLAPGRRDRITGGPLLPLPVRSARLVPSDPLPAYRAAAAESHPLEAAIAAHLERARAARTDPAPGSLPDARRDQLRALGYLE